jgi:hypothetical protein
MSGVAVELWGEDGVDLDPTALVAAAGPIVAFGGVSWER